jgi:hypothetical protein
MHTDRADDSHFEKDEVLRDEYAPSKDSDGLSINEAARGDNLPDNYYLSWHFIGTLLVSLTYHHCFPRELTRLLQGLCLAQIGAYIFLILPTNVLAFINEVGRPSHAAVK